MEVADAPGGERPDRTGGNRVDADIVAAEIDGEIPHAGFERRLCDAHYVIIRHHPLGAGIGERQQAAAVRHQWRGATADIGERKAGNIESAQRNWHASSRRIFLSARPGPRRRSRGPRNRADPSAAPTAAKTASRLSAEATSASRTKFAAETKGERPYPLPQRLALICEGEVGAMSVQRLRDPPGDRPLVGDTHDEALLTRHQRHRLPQFPICGDPTRRKAPRPIRVAPEGGTFAGRSLFNSGEDLSFCDDLCRGTERAAKRKAAADPRDIGRLCDVFATPLPRRWLFFRFGRAQLYDPRFARPARRYRLRHAVCLSDLRAGA